MNQETNQEIEDVLAQLWRKLEPGTDVEKLLLIGRVARLMGATRDELAEAAMKAVLEE